MNQPYLSRIALCVYQRLLREHPGHGTEEALPDILPQALLMGIVRGATDGGCRAAARGRARSPRCRDTFRELLARYDSEESNPFRAGDRPLGYEATTNSIRQCLTDLDRGDRRRAARRFAPYLAWMCHEAFRRTQSPVSPFPRVLYGTAWKKADTQRLVELAVRKGFRGIDTRLASPSTTMKPP